jgi:hypothetical protein
VRISVSFAVAAMYEKVLPAHVDSKMTLVFDLIFCHLAQQAPAALPMKSMHLPIYLSKIQFFALSFAPCHQL